MSQDDKDAGLQKAIAFFERAEEVAATDNFDYAIDMYLEGLRHSPDALEDGHAPLRRMALIRQGKGGKGPSIADKVKRRGGKTPLDEMLNAEYLLAKDPDHLPYAEAVLKACVGGSYKRTGAWIAQLIFDATRASSKPSQGTYLMLKDCYASLDMFEQAIAACHHAVELKPGDGALQDELRDLSARLTVQKGKYGQDGDFRQSIKDKRVQDKLHSQESLVKTVDYREEAVDDARKALAQAPDSTANVMKLADALADLETEQGCQEALELLENAYSKTQDFSYQQKAGLLKIKKLRSQLRQAKAAFEAEGGNNELKAKFSAVSEKLNQAALEHYRRCVENYPTDLKMKYEYGICLMKNKQYDAAIPFFQEARKDPRYRLAAINKTGYSFFLKGWYSDAIDIFNQAIEACEVKDSDVGKELRYNLARSCEEDGQTDRALEIYRKLAQLDFGFKDVGHRVNKLRNNDQ